MPENPHYAIGISQASFFVPDTAKGPVCMPKFPSAATWLLRQTYIPVDGATAVGITQLSTPSPLIKDRQSESEPDDHLSYVRRMLYVAAKPAGDKMGRVLRARS